MELIRELKREFIYKAKRRIGLFKCGSCGIEVKVRMDDGIKNKSCSISCASIKHGDASNRSGKKRERVYSVWMDIRGRCTNKNNARYKYYGGKGITLCNEWAEYIDFKKWALSNGYSKTLTIDRIDSSLGYYPENCRFISKELNTVRRDYVFLSFKDAEKIRRIYSDGGITMKELAVKFKTTKSNVSTIISLRSWTKEITE